MSGVIGGTQLQGQEATFNAIMPPEGPLVVPQFLDFTTIGTWLVDFTQQMMSKTITAIQSVVVRNWNNPNPLTIAIQGSQETLDVPGYADAVLQVLASNRAKFTISTTTGVVVPIWFVNVPLSPIIIYNPAHGMPVTGTITVTIPGTIAVTGTVDTIAAPQGTIAPAATAVATGGTAVNVFVSPTAPVRVLNPTGAAEPLFIDLLHNAGTVESGSTMELVPGQGVTFPPFTGTLTANAATSGHLFTAYGPAG